MEIYTINKDIQENIDKYYSCFDEDGCQSVSDEDLNIIEQELFELQNQKNDFIEWLLKNRANILGNIEGLKTEIERLEKSKEILEKRINQTEKFINTLVKPFYQGKTINYGLFNVGYRASKATIIDNEEEIPQDYKEKKITISIDKKAIKKAIEEGKDIKGARIEERQNLFIK